MKYQRSNNKPFSNMIVNLYHLLIGKSKEVPPINLPMRYGRTWLTVGGLLPPFDIVVDVKLESGEVCRAQYKYTMLEHGTTFYWQRTDTYKTIVPTTWSFIPDDGLLGNFP